MAMDSVEVAALGRPFNLGMLYDARKDQLIPGLILWDDKTLQNKATKSSHHNSDFDISASDSIESKSSLLDVGASLKASFLSGLIEVGGSAEYLNDTKKFKNQSRVTFQYKATTDFKQLSVTQLPAMDTHQMDIIKKSSATHVVTGILYGANAFFVFDSEKLEASSVQDIKGHMEDMIKKIPAFDVEGKAEIKLTDEEKALTNKFSCKFYGDFILESNPATFEDAVKTYVQLPKLLGGNEENVVPLKVWLMPLKNLFPEAPELISGISIALLAKVQDVLGDLKEIGMRCNDSMVDRVVENFPHIVEELRTLQKLCNYYVSYIQRTLAKKLPTIRDGEEDECSVRKLFDDRDKSPFSHEKLTKWLDHKEREINVIRSCVDVMEGTKIVTNQSELDREVLAVGVEDALCFVFTSTEKGDAYLDEMAKYLDSPTLGSTNEDEWYYSGEVFAKMKQKAKDFHDLSKVLKSSSSRFRFLIAVMANKKYKGATIYHYKDGSLVTDDFSKPDIHNVETITDRRDLIWYACDLTLDPDTANNYLHLSEGDKKATCGEWQSNIPDHPERFDTGSNTQVLCKQGLTGRHYWEVEWSDGGNQSVYVAVAYCQIKRKGGSSESQFGYNSVSWCVGQYVSPSLSKLKAWHDSNVMWETPFSSGCRKLGVFLDWPAGTLSYYSVSCTTVSHLYTFHTRFTDPVYPGLWVYYTSNYAYLCPIK